MQTPIEINPKTKPTATIIILHGLGADGHDFEDIVPQLKLPKDHSIRFVMPHAPIRPVTINGGFEMRAWYDIHGLAAPVREDEVGIRESEKTLHELIAHENSLGIATDRIILAGFSQGGAMALHTGLRYPEKLAGIIALSTYIPISKTLPGEASDVNKTLPVFMAHGTKDPIVLPEWGESSKKILDEMGCSVEWHEYEMEHSICLEEVVDMRGWILSVL